MRHHRSTKQRCWAYLRAARGYKPTRTWVENLVALGYRGPTEYTRSPQDKRRIAHRVEVMARQTGPNGRNPIDWQDRDLRRIPLPVCEVET